VSKEIDQLLVKCPNHGSGCPWQGKFKDFKDHEGDCDYKPQPCPNDGCKELIPKSELKNHQKNKCGYRAVTCRHCKRKTIANQLEAHYEECEQYPVKCDRCSQSVRKSQLEDHQENQCPYVACLCGETIKRKDVDAHYRESGALHKHMSAMQMLCGAVMRAQKQLQSKQEEKSHLLELKTTHTGEIVRVEKEIEKFRSQFDNRMLLLEKKLGSVESLRSEVAESRREASQLGEASRALRGRLDAQEEKVRQVQGQVVVAKGRQGSGRYTDSFSESRVGLVERKMEELERQNAMLKVHVSELELQLQASLASTHNGSFLWRIPDVTRRRKDAIDEKITSIYSPPFYTGRNGYKMCIRAYLNGDGIGFKSHLSLFFVLMRGEYDPLLKWPFEHKVSLILVDQDHRKHIVQTFKPTPDSSSFKRPTSDMNVASGCPQFSKNDVLTQDNYVKDDIMYIKCIVDVSRIFHP
jgi:TNF receptor-associated factor 2/TNF receptor-associated factor 3